MAKTPRVALYSSYVPGPIGGGERYFFSSAELLSSRAKVDILHTQDQPIDLSLYEKQFGLDLSNVAQKHLPTSAIGKIFTTLRYHSMLAMTDGSLFFTGARRRVLHIQFPFTNSINGIINRIKLHHWGIRNANSAFTQQIVQDSWNTKIQWIHEPYVDGELFKSEKKENIILNVGRFYNPGESGAHPKNQDVLIEAFRSAVDRGLTGWRLILLGGFDSSPESAEYMRKLETLAKGYPVKILTNLSQSAIAKYYSISRIYWHGAGYNQDVSKHPGSVEHFGISILEAMSSGTVPVVVPVGGPATLVSHRTTGMHWTTVDDLIRFTLEIIDNPSLESALRDSAISRAKENSKTHFAQQLYEMMNV